MNVTCGTRTARGFRLDPSGLSSSATHDFTVIFIGRSNMSRVQRFYTMDDKMSETAKQCQRVLVGEMLKVLLFIY